MTLFSYVVEHDRGDAPNPYSGICTLCICKFRKKKHGRANIVERANKEDWIVGTGGKNRQRSAGHGRIVYAMRVDEKVSREKYHRRQGEKRRDATEPKSAFEKKEQFALISHLPNFFYFGASSVAIPSERVIPHLEKRGPGFRRDFDEAEILRFVGWLRRKHKPGMNGVPCMTDDREGKQERIETCKSSC